MKTKIIDFITKSNHVIFFVGSLLFMTFLATMLIKEMIRPDYSNRGVEIAKQIDNENKTIDIKYEKSYFQSIKDIHIIKVTSERIMVNEDKSNSKLLSLFDGGYDDRNTVNLIFSSESGSNLKLFENDLLITNIETARFTSDTNLPLLDKNIYSVVISDSNEDGFLKYNDNKDLYLSDYNGEGLELIMSGIQNSRVIANNRLLISKLETEVSEMYLYDIIGKKTTKLNTDIKK